MSDPVVENPSVREPEFHGLPPVKKSASSFAIVVYGLIFLGLAWGAYVLQQEVTKPVVTEIVSDGPLRASPIPPPPAPPPPLADVAGAEATAEVVSSLPPLESNKTDEPLAEKKAEGKSNEELAPVEPQLPAPVITQESPPPSPAPVQIPVEEKMPEIKKLPLTAPEKTPAEVLRPTAASQPPPAEKRPQAIQAYLDFVEALAGRVVGFFAGLWPW